MTTVQDPTNALEDLESESKNAVATVAAEYTGSVISNTTEQEHLDAHSAPLVLASSSLEATASDLDVPSQVIIPPDDAADVDGAILRVILPENGSDNPPFIVMPSNNSQHSEAVSCPVVPSPEPESSLSAEAPLKQQQEPSSTPMSARDLDHMDEYIRSPEVQNSIVDRSPGGRYVRFLEKLGSGASKDVYRAYDTQEGIEVAWNVVNLSGVPKSERNRIVNEVRLLERLHHQNIISFHGSWVNRERQEVNFVTEILSSGTLKSFINKVQLIRWKIAKRWATQILKGLEYLHAQDPPVIHRDLKAANIFINGTSGDLRIGDLGLSTVHRNGRVLSVLGTPAFMAPDMYEDGSYDVKVDIYAFGMVLLEIFTKELPYSECMNPAQIYKKVSSGEPPEVLKRLESRHAREFVMQCLGYKDDTGKYIRPTATELLQHPFLEIREGLDDEEVLVRPSLRESAISEAGESSYSTLPVDTPSKYKSSASDRQKSQSEVEQAPSGGHSSSPSSQLIRQRLTSTDMDDDDDGDRFDEMPQSESNFRRVKVLMGRGHELEDKSHDSKPGTAVNSVDSQIVNGVAPPSVEIASRNKQYLVAAAVVGPLDPGTRPYPDDILKLVVTLPVDGQTQNVQFDFHLIEDDPVQVAKEMVLELDIPNDAILEISQTISGLARTARMQVEAFNVRANELRLALSEQASVASQQSMQSNPQLSQSGQPIYANSSGHFPAPVLQHVPAQSLPPIAVAQGQTPQHYEWQHQQLSAHPGLPIVQPQAPLQQTLPVPQFQHAQIHAPMPTSQIQLPMASHHQPLQAQMPQVQAQQQLPQLQIQPQQQMPNNQQSTTIVSQQELSMQNLSSYPNHLQQQQQMPNSQQSTSVVSQQDLSMRNSNAYLNQVQQQQQLPISQQSTPIFAQQELSMQMPNNVQQQQPQVYPSTQSQGQVQQMQHHVPHQISLPSQQHGPPPLMHGPSSSMQQQQWPQVQLSQPSIVQAQTSAPAVSLNLQPPVQQQNVEPSLFSANPEATNLPRRETQPEASATVCSSITFANEWVTDAPAALGPVLAPRKVDIEPTNSRANDAAPPLILDTIQNNLPKLVQRSGTAGSQNDTTFATSPSMNGSTGPVSPIGSDDDTDIDSDASDPEMDEELRKLEEEYQKNLQRAKKVFENRMESLQRTQIERETQHRKLLEKHEKEKLEFDKRLSNEEMEQRSRLEVLEREWQKKRDELAESRRGAQKKAVNASMNGQQHSLEQQSVIEASDRSQERSFSNLLVTLPTEQEGTDTKSER